MNNRWIAYAAFTGVAGALLKAENFTAPSGASPGRSVQSMYDENLYWVREYLVYAMGPNGTHGDSDRLSDDSHDVNPNWYRGFSYYSHVLALLSYNTDIMARMGDFRGYNFATRSGGGISSSALSGSDPDKTVRWAVEYLASYIAEERDHYAGKTDMPINNDYKIKSWQRAGGNERWYNREFGMMALNNLYFRSDLLRRVAERNPGGGHPGIPNGYNQHSSDTTQGYSDSFAIGREGECVMFPGVFFMWLYPEISNMADWPWPYPTEAPS